MQSDGQQLEPGRGAGAPPPPVSSAGDADVPHVRQPVLRAVLRGLALAAGSIETGFPRLVRGEPQAQGGEVTTMAYARTTNVSASRSRDEIHELVIRRGASGFGFAEEGGRAMIQFRIEGRLVRFVLPMPDVGDFQRSPGGKTRTAQAQQNAYDQEIRSRWRRLLLVIRAKFEAADTGITDIEAEFLAHTVLPDGRLVQEWLDPQIEMAYATGKMPPMIPGNDAPLALPPGSTRGE